MLCLIRMYFCRMDGICRTNFLLVIVSDKTTRKRMKGILFRVVSFL